MPIPTRKALIPITDENGRVIGDMPTTVSVLCATCKHWRANMQCDAYPGVIPSEIWDGRVDHRQPYPGDHGIRYELNPNLIPPPELTSP